MPRSEVNDIKDSIRDIKENHLAHIEPDLASVKTNVEWLMKYHWIIASASIGALVTGLINLMSK